MTCQLQDRDFYIAAYVSGDLDETQMAFFEDHYFECKVCMDDLRLAQDVTRVIEVRGDRLRGNESDAGSQNIHRLPLSANRDGNKLRNWMAVAAAILIFFAAGLWLLQTPELPLDEPSFAAAPDLEALLTVRSGIDAQATPTDSSIFEAEDISLTWITPNQTRQPWRLEVILGTPRTVVLDTFSASSAFKLVHNHLSPGRYYWRLSDTDNTVHVGYFFLLK